MTIKNKIYLLVSILTLVAVIIAMLQTYSTIVLFGVAIEPIWIVIWIFALVLPILNLVEIINNRNDSNAYYWIGLLFNILTVIFIMRYYKMDLF